MMNMRRVAIKTMAVLAVVLVTVGVYQRPANASELPMGLITNGVAYELAAEEQITADDAQEPEALASEEDNASLQAIHELLSEYIKTREESDTETRYHRQSLIEYFEALKVYAQDFKTMMLYSLAMNAFLLAMIFVLICAVIWGHH